MDDHIFRHFDNMMRTFNSHFETLFGEFDSPFPGLSDGFHSGFGQPHSGFFVDTPALDNSIEQYPQKRSLREDFLEPGSSSRRTHDEDLDRKIERYGVGSVLMPNQHTNPFDQPFSNQAQQPFKSYFKSWQFSSVMNGDKIEERKVETDASGSRIESHTRKLGDKSYTITSKADSSGKQEIEENLYNMDEKDLTEFEKMWKSGFSYSPWIKEKGQFESMPEMKAIEDASEHNKPRTWKEKLKSWLPALK